jgi:hypothetical protein
MTKINKLAGLEKRFRPERFTFDLQISGGKTSADLQQQTNIITAISITPSTGAPALIIISTYGLLHGHINITPY